MTVHHLKTHPEPFAAVLAGSKIHEFRKDDRNFQVGDYLVLQEYDPATSTFSGRETCRRVTYKGTGYGIPEGYCCLSMKPILPPPASTSAPCAAQVCALAKPTGVTCPHDSCDLESGTRTMPKAIPAAYKADIKQRSLDRKMIYQEVDGYYVYQRGTQGGFLSSLELRTLAEILDEMNAEWDAQVQADPRLREQSVPPPSTATTVFDGDDCPKCGGDLVGLAHSDGSWLDGTKVQCATCGHIGHVSADDGEAWLQEEPSDHTHDDMPGSKKDTP